MDLSETKRVAALRVETPSDSAKIARRQTKDLVNKTSVLGNIL
jgi:hypothetical protein